MLKSGDTTWSCMPLLYTLRQPQPPTKYIRFYEICQSLYTRIVKIKFLTLVLGYCKIAIMTDINKKILVVRKIQYSHRDDYYIEKTADTLDEASKYLVALEALNDDKDRSYHLFNAYGIIDAEKNNSVEENKEARI